MSSPALPLLGLNIVVTRAMEAEDLLGRKLKSLGAEVLHVPCISIEPILPVAADLALDTYDSIAFTSANAVSSLFTHWLEVNEIPDGIKIYAVGPGTQESLKKFGKEKVITPPTECGAKELIEFMLPVEGQHILFPCSDISSDVLPTQLQQNGAKVDVLRVYRTIKTPPSSEIISMVFERANVLLTFASPSAVRSFAEAAQNAGVFDSLIPAICIGKTTEAEALKSGYKNTHTAGKQSIDGLIQTIIAHHANQKPPQART